MRWWKHLFETVMKEETLGMAFDAVIESKKEEDRRHPERPSRARHFIGKKDVILKGIRLDLMRRSYHLTIRPSFDRVERGKLRRITPPSFRDSVVFHAIIIALEPHMVPSFYYYSLGSIPGKGPWIGLNNLASKLKDDRKHTKYCLQIDVRKFYESIPRDLLYEKFKRHIKDDAFLWLLKIVIDEQPGTGLPLGAFTSGWFANFYLSKVDHFIKAKKVKYYYRYVDDMVMLGPNKKKLHTLRKDIDEELHKLGLDMKHNWQVYKIDCRKVDFLGFRTGREVRIDRKKNMLEFSRFTKKYGRSPTPSQASSIESRRGRCRKFASRTFLEEHIEPFTSREKNRRILRNESRRIHEISKRAV